MTTQTRSNKRKGKAPMSESPVAGPSARRLPVTPATTQQSVLRFAPPPQNGTPSNDSQSTEHPLSTALEVEDDREVSQPPS